MTFPRMLVKFLEDTEAVSSMASTAQQRLCLRKPHLDDAYISNKDWMRLYVSLLISLVFYSAKIPESMNIGTWF